MVELPVVRTTIDIPDTMYRKLKSRAAAQGRSVKELILEGVEREFHHENRQKKRIKLPIVRSKEPGTLDLTNEEIYGLIPFP
jgi:hypothetical protein